MKKPERQVTTTHLVEKLLRDYARKHYLGTLTQPLIAAFVGRDARQVNGALRWLLASRVIERRGKRGRYGYRIARRPRDDRKYEIPLIVVERRPHGTGWRTAGRV